jgi:hypothetical protein
MWRDGSQERQICENLRREMELKLAADAIGII